ncbi:MAG TPA: hypothetical protein VL727_07340 [Puia sp.]|nr:hypothetical protein [Puia sp.]
MEHLLDSFLDRFAVLYAGQTFETPEFNRDHIFHSILRACSASAGDQRRLDMYYQFVTQEKILSLARRRRHTLVADRLERLERTKPALEGLAATGMDALYYPMLAYIDYTTGRYGIALEHMDRSLDAIRHLESIGILDAIYALNEQTLNKFRIYCSQRQREKAILFGSELIRFVTGNNRLNDSPVINGDWEGLFAREPELSQQSTIHHSTNAVLVRLVSWDKTEPGLIAEFISVLYASGDWQRCPLRGYRPALEALIHFNMGAIPAFMKIVEQLLPDLPALPRQLTRLVLAELMQVADTNEYPRTAQLENTLLEWLGDKTPLLIQPTPIC